MTKYVGALDQGTTSTRFMIFDQQGNAIGTHQLEHQQIYPQAGWVEHDPMEIWYRTQEVMQGALERAGLSAADLAAVGITNQRETTVVWNRNTGRPYANALVWQDTRTDKICSELATAGGQNRFRITTGLPLATYFSGPKIKWILDNIPGVRRDAELGLALFGNIDTWLIWNLTGGPNGGAHVTDVTNASRTLLMNLHTLDWEREILETMGVPHLMLPAIRPSSDSRPYGSWNGVPVCGDLGDQQAALVGQACFDTGSAKNTYGTGCFMLLNTGARIVESPSGLLTTVAYKLGDAPAVYALEGSIAIAGALVQWLRDNLKFFEASAQVEQFAKLVPDSGGVYIVPAFSGLFAPYWQSDARGIIVGLTRYITKEHLCRAALESTAYQTREVLDAMEKDSGVSLRTLKVDGGMVFNHTLMQFQSDILDVPVVRPAVAETTALGAAYAAGLAVGYWNGLEDLRSNWLEDQTWQPAMNGTTREMLYRGWLRAVQRSMHWLQD